MNKGGSDALAELESQFAREEEAFQADARARQAEQVAWYNAQRSALRRESGLSPDVYRGPDQGRFKAAPEQEHSFTSSEAMDEPRLMPAYGRVTTGSAEAAD
jgi:hypothetical protein